MAKTKNHKPEKKHVFKKRHDNKNDTGAPTKFNKELADKICELTANNALSLDRICKLIGISRVAVVLWLQDETKKDFFINYYRAKEEQASAMADKQLEISEEAHELVTTRKISNFKASPYIQATKLYSSVLQWHASKLAPKRFGDKLDLTSGGEKIKQVLNVTVTTEERKTVIDNI